jgi:hypothetical protein
MALNIVQITVMLQTVKARKLYSKLMEKPLELSH